METMRYERVANAIIAASGFTQESLTYKNRRRFLVLTRQVVFYALINNKLCTLTEAGEIFEKDHATVSHGKKTIELLLETKYPAELYEYATTLINIANEVINSSVPKVQGQRNLRGFSAQQPPRQHNHNGTMPPMRRRPGYAGANGNPPYPISRMRLQQQGITQ
ncbi:MAG TPA: helix-turn-helix domain-containing protein [Williamwhitmania sp.]|nr:helix-turn-helix domain-containing protein [Williamwhitmania sp.]